MENELKSCPWCPEPPRVMQVSDRRWKFGWVVTCDADDCLVQPMTDVFETEAEAVTTWNTRAQQTSERERVLEEALRKYVGVRDGFGKISANLALGLPCDHEFYCHNPDDQDNGCLHDTEGRMKHPCKHCGKTRAALNREARF